MEIDLERGQAALDYAQGGGGEEDWSRILGKWSGGEDVDGFGEIYDISERFAVCSLFCVSLFLSFSLFFFFLLFFFWRWFY